MGTVTRIRAIAVVPGFPGIAVDEPEGAGVGGQPAVRGGWAEVELGAVAVQRGARRCDPLRVGVGGEQARLLGVGAEGRGDREGQPVAARGGANPGGNETSRGRTRTRFLRPARTAAARARAR